MKVNAILPFNGEIDLKPSYEVKADAYHKKGKIVIVDRSASMSSLEHEFRLVMSMVTALAGLDRDITVPKPNGSTNLIGKIQSIVESGSLKQQELIVITDGLDNAHDINKIQIGVDDDGQEVTVTLDNSGHYETYMKERQDAILKYLEFLGCQVHLIGIGNEVKNLLKMAAPHRMTVAHINNGASSEEVANVVNAAIRITRSYALTETDAETGAETGAGTSAETHAQARIINAGNLAGIHPLSQEDVTMIEQNSERIHVTDDVVTIESFKMAFEEAEAITLTDVNNEAKRYTRGVVLFLMNLSLTQGAVPGAAIGGKYSKIFAPPTGVTHWPVNQLLSELKKQKIMTSTRYEKATFVHDNKTRNFNKVECYEVVPSVRPLIPDILADSWTVPPDQLVKIDTTCVYHSKRTASKRTVEGLMVG